MSEKTGIQWTDYPEIERFVAGVQALCAEAMKSMEAAADPSGLLEADARVPISYRAILEVMILHDALLDALRCVKWYGGEKPRCE